MPKSCGPCCSLQINVISLPDFTYKSDGPSILAFSSTIAMEEEQEEKEVKKWVVMAGKNVIF